MILDIIGRNIYIEKKNMRKRGKKEMSARIPNTHTKRDT